MYSAFGKEYGQAAAAAKEKVTILSFILFVHICEK